MKSSDVRICAVVPTYQNAGTLSDVLGRISAQLTDIIVVDDGSTDATREVLDAMGKGALWPEGTGRTVARLRVVRHIRNRGKGHALKSGFRKAAEEGFTHVITIDSDGQHFPEDIPLFLEAVRQHPQAIIIGSRNIRSENMPGKNTFANKFSNFWFMVQTCRRLEDTQTGFRAYPLHRISGTALMTSRYEAELELLVFSAWNGAQIVPVPIRVYYPPEGERITHFRPFADFARISILNTFLCAGAIVYGLPSIGLRKLFASMRKSTRP